MYSSDSRGQYNIYEVGENGVNRLVTMSVNDLLTSINRDLQNVNNNMTTSFDNIRAKDLRRLDHNLDFGNNEAIISIRKNVVIFSIDSTRAVVLNNKIYFIAPNGADGILKLLSGNIGGNNQTDSFEYQAYDALLKVTKHYDAISLENMKNDFEILARQMKRSSIISLSVQEKLKTLKTTISNASKHFTLIKNLLDELLDDDEKLSYMNLSLLKTQSELFELDENEIVATNREKMSSLFEIYLYDYTNLLFQINSLNDKIEHEEEYTILKSSLLQNQYMLINMIISILTCVIGFCAYITGLFGMNLDNVQYIQPVRGVFNGVLITTILFIPSTTLIILWIMQKNDLIPS